MEDDPTIRKMVTIMVRQTFPELTLLPAENGQEGLALYERERPEIVLTDIRMPIMDGIRMAREIRSLDNHARIVVLTANNDTSRLLEAIEIGINHYVLKPIDRVKLQAAIEQCLAGLRLEQQLREREEHIR
ncbi:MAG TPA: response regulator, partial [Desulfuromonadales bacterium]